MAITYLPGHPTRRRVAAYRAQLLAGVTLYPVQMIKDGIRNPARVINLLRRAGLPIVTDCYAEEIEPDAPELAEIAGIDGGDGVPMRQVYSYWMRPEEIARHEADPEGQGADTRAIYRINRRKRRNLTAAATLEENGYPVPVEIARWAAVQVPETKDGFSRIPEDTRAMMAADAEQQPMDA